MFMYKMYPDSTISERTFSFYMTGLSGQSYIDFGTPNTAIMTSASDILWMNILSEDYWWSQYITGFKWGSTMNDATEYKIDTISALTDTGTSCIIGPTSAVASIRNQILNLATNVSTSSSWDYLFDCSSKSSFPEFELLYGGYWFKVTADDYTIEVSSSSQTCALCLSAYDNL